jgi:cyclophilin family peptidyl-prolyl cis-trans isomerase
MRIAMVCWVGLVSGLLASGCHPNQTEQTSESVADLRLITDLGTIEVDLWDETPQHRDNFLTLARQGFFDGMAFHRVIDQFMVQTGDPRTRIQYPPTDTTAPDGPGYTLAPEIGPYSVNTPGHLGAARLGDDKNPERRSAGSQFYFVSSGPPVSNRVLDSMEQAYTAILRGRLYEAYQDQVAQGTYQGRFDDYQTQQGFEPWHYPQAIRNAYRKQGGAYWLDFSYTVFGQVTKGLSIVEQIAQTATDDYDRPSKPIRIQRVEVLATTHPE